jgi:hypothetical protein
MSKRVQFRTSVDNELGADRASVIEKLADDARLPQDAMSDARRLLAIDPPQIGFRAHQQHEIGRLDLPLAPCRPPSGGEVSDLGVDAVLAQPVGEIENSILMFRRVVAVADKDLGWPASHRLLLSTSTGKPLLSLSAAARRFARVLSSRA